MAGLVAETHERLELFNGLKTVIGSRQLRPAFQPVRRLSDGGIMGYEALIRGPQGSTLEPPTVLFAVALGFGSALCIRLGISLP